jgi:hypothetical protein
MKRAVSYSVLLLPALIALPLAHKTSAAGAQTEMRHTIIATSGDAAPAGGNYTPFF